jgi:hypothetical protein
MNSSVSPKDEICFPRVCHYTPNAAYIVSCRNFEDCEVRSYVRNGVGGDWFSENMTLANGVTGAWWTREGKEEREVKTPKVAVRVSGTF